MPADKDLKSVISEIDFEKYDFFEMYSNSEYLKNKEKEEKDKKEKERNDISLSRLSSQCKSFLPFFYNFAQLFCVPVFVYFLLLQHEH